jgi:hypothetical protein
LKIRSITAGLACTALLAAGCGGLSNTITGVFGGSGKARLIVASPTTTQTNIALLADQGIINSGLSAGIRIGPYAKVTSGNVSFDINTGAGTSDIVPAINVSIVSSTNYSVVLEGEPGGLDYQAFALQDTNALPSTVTVRYKVNNAAPNLATPVDVYIWPSTGSLPSTPTVPSLGLNQDSGSAPSHPGNAYIPQSGSQTTLPAGTYSVAIVPEGGVPNGSSDLFDGTSSSLSLNTSYSFTIDDMDGTQNNIGVILSIDEPFQSGNQLSITRHSVSLTR